MADPYGTNPLAESLKERDPLRYEQVAAIKEPPKLFANGTADTPAFTASGIDHNSCSDFLSGSATQPPRTPTSCRCTPGSSSTPACPKSRSNTKVYATPTARRGLADQHRPRHPHTGAA
jgi:hypothetical protein